MSRRVVFFLVWFFAASSSFAASPDVVRGSQGMVASRSLIASEVGVEIMRQGGNAIDAAVAVGFALAVTYPSAGNLGGGGFLVFHPSTGDVETLDFREVAPKSAHRDMFLDAEGNVIKGMSTKTHAASGVPGTVDGLLSVLEKHGSMTRQQVIAPAIKLALEGFALNYDLASSFAKQLDKMAAFPGSMAVFSQSGKPYKEGDTWHQKDLAETLTRISKQGKDGFYQGKTADFIVAEMARGNGQISLEDLKNYRSVWRKPIKGEFNGYQIWSMPPPSSGGALVVQMLNMLEPYDLKSMGWGSAAYTHHLVEAQRRAYADRAVHYGDPDFVDVPLDKLLDKGYAKARFSDFETAKATDSRSVGAGSWPEESLETTHYSVMDGEGNAVSVTTTLNLGYGSKIVVQGAGFLLNNEMDDFSAKPNSPNSYGLLGAEANAIESGKRMLSSMTPTIVAKEGKPYLVTGSPGGSTIINTVLQVTLNVLVHEMPLSDAVALPRIHHQWLPDKVYYEKFSLSPDTLKILDGFGHKLSPARWRMGDANSILWKEGVLMGMGDPRNAGGAAGY